MALFSSSTGLDLAHPELELSEVRFPVEWWAGRTSDARSDRQVHEAYDGYLLGK
jgi:hypothetical protein